jgi:hypothetical protein
MVVMSNPDDLGQTKRTMPPASLSSQPPEAETTILLRIDSWPKWNDLPVPTVYVAFVAMVILGVFLATIQGIRTTPGPIAIGYVVLTGTVCGGIKLIERVQK